MSSEDIDSDRYEKVRHSIYCAAKEGHPLSLIAALNDIEDPDLKNFLVNQTYDEDDSQSFTPLAVASTFGKYTVVKALLSNFKVNIEKECIVKFDGHIVSGGTALWCAAGAGHLNIVKLLIKHGSNVNHRTKAHSTPLRAACFEGRLDIVRYLVMHGADVHLANVYNNTCLMISAYKGHSEIVDYLLHVGANPNEKALCGATALHYAAESGLAEICNSLLDYGASLQPNEYGLSPVLTAAERTHENVVKMFVMREGLLTTEEKIDAYELMGASFANDKDNYNINKSHKYLMTSMNLRFIDPNNIIKKKWTPSIPAYDNWIESQNLQELQAIRFNHNSIHMESLAIRERILGKNYPDLPQPIVFRGAIHADQRQFDKCESLWLYALQLRQNNKVSVERDLLRFAQLFSQMLHLGNDYKFSNILEVLSACITELEQNKSKIAKPGPKDDVSSIADEYEQNVVTALYLITIITNTLKNSTQKFQAVDLTSLYKMVFRVNKMNPKLRDGQSIIHLAVNGVTPVDDFHTSDVCRFPCVDTVKLLLHCGASVMDTDCDRNTPLHTLTSTLQNSRSVDFEQIIIVEKVMKHFIEAGVHLDAINKHGLTAANVCPLQVIERLVKQYETQFTTLKCLSSRCIALHKINYKGSVPRNLESFIQMHSAEKL